MPRGARQPPAAPAAPPALDCSDAAPPAQRYQTPLVQRQLQLRCLLALLTLPLALLWELGRCPAQTPCFVGCRCGRSPEKDSGPCLGLSGRQPSWTPEELQAPPVCLRAGLYWACVGGTCPAACLLLPELGSCAPQPYPRHHPPRAAAALAAEALGASQDWTHCSASELLQGRQLLEVRWVREPWALRHFGVPGRPKLPGWASVLEPCRAVEGGMWVSPEAEDRARLAPLSASRAARKPQTRWAQHLPTLSAPPPGAQQPCPLPGAAV